MYAQSIGLLKVAPRPLARNEACWIELNGGGSLTYPFKNHTKRKLKPTYAILDPHRMPKKTKNTKH